ncbi:MAG: hypothetical protein COB60_07525 [Flavobacteriaceae bacterium]|nr:MAG: hypothetical protein COB60_07525 [Flavobacteriaceae bacterium]
MFTIQKQRYITLLLILFTTIIQAQQDPLYTQYFNNLPLLNPSFTGQFTNTTFTLSTRNQWTGIEDAPGTQSFAIGLPLNNKIGIGFSIVNDQVSVLKETHFFTDISYTIQVQEQASVSFGLKAGGSSLNADLLSLNISDDPAFNQNIDEFNANFGIGVNYITKNYYIGLSALNLLEKKHFDKSNNNFSSSASEKSKFYMNGGYNYLLNEFITLKPSFITRYVQGTPLSMDLSLNGVYNQLLEAGVSYRFGESVATLLQFNLSDAFKMGYSYDYVFGNLGEFSNGSHELFFQITIGEKKEIKPVENIIFEEHN